MMANAIDPLTTMYHLLATADYLDTVGVHPEWVATLRMLASRDMKKKPDLATEIKACQECGKKIEVKVNGRGGAKRRVFCSDTCKLRDWRRRKEAT